MSLAASVARRTVSRTPLSDCCRQLPVTGRTRLCMSRQLLAGVRSSFSTEALEHRVGPKFAVVDHSDAYEEAMSGRHGRQLALAYEEGKGKDDPPYDPFDVLVNEEMEEVTKEVEKVEGGETDEIENAEFVEMNEADYEEEYDSIDEDEDMGVAYNNDGSIVRPKSELAALKAGAPAGGRFAIIELAGFQHKVAVDDVIVSNKLRPVKDYSIGSTHTLDPLLVGSSHMTLVGLPVVQGAQVKVMVEEITRDATVIVFKKRRKKHSRRKNGFRREVTMLRVTDIVLPEPYNDHAHK